MQSSNKIIRKELPQLLVLLQTLTTLPGYAQSSNPSSVGSAGSTKPPLLKSTIQIDAYLPPLDPLLQPGKSFNQDALAALKGMSDASNANTFRKIPNWYAGTWQTEEARLDKAADSSGKVTAVGLVQKKRTVMVNGVAQDRWGDVWSKISFGLRSEPATADSTTFDMNLESRMLISRDNKTLSHFGSGIDIRIDNQSKKIISAARAESVDLYQPLPFSEMALSRIYRKYNAAGQVEGTSYYSVTYHQVAPFRPDKQFTEEFHAFLRQIGKEDLIP